MGTPNFPRCSEYARSTITLMLNSSIASSGEINKASTGHPPPEQTFIKLLQTTA